MTTVDAVIVTTRAERQAKRAQTAELVGRKLGSNTYGVYRVGKEAVVLTGIAGKGAVAGFVEARDADMQAQAQLQLAIAN